MGQGEQRPQSVHRRSRQREECQRKLDARILEAAELRKARNSKHSPIAADDVARVFDDSCVEWLACIGDLPAAGDMKILANGIRDATRIYARDAREPATVNELYSEIEMLHKAAEGRQHEQLADILAVLSARARDLLNDRGARPN